MKQISYPKSKLLAFIITMMISVIIIIAASITYKALFNHSKNEQQITPPVYEKTKSN